MKLIINADDCGKSTSVNAAIRRYIDAGKLTSTTIMANMEDLDGAAKLYEDYKTKVSFGVHLNLTEGKPLLKSELLLSKGLYIQDGNDVYFNLSKYRNKLYNSDVLNELYNELCAQVDRIMDYGINISHIDSHHHIHTSLLLISLLPKLSHHFGIYKIRRMRNFAPNISGFNKILRDSWAKIIKCENKQIKVPDYFGIYEEWYDSGRKIVPNQVVELMCHPGGEYKDEEIKLLNTEFNSLKNLQLITYNDL